MSKYCDDDDQDMPEGVFIPQEDFDELVLDQEMDTHAALILFEYIKGLRDDSCTCPKCIVERMADDHGGIQ